MSMSKKSIKYTVDSPLILPPAIGTLKQPVKNRRNNTTFTRHASWLTESVFAFVKHLPICIGAG